MNRCWRLWAVLALLGAGVGAEEPSYFAIRNARIIPVKGPVIENGTVVIHDGLITAVGTDVRIPAAATRAILDVMPGTLNKYAY